MWSAGAVAALARGGVSDVVGTARSEATYGNAQRQRREMERAGCVARLRHPVLSASAVVAYVAVGAAAILSRSVTEAARGALAWVLPRDGRAQQSKG